VVVKSIIRLAQPQEKPRLRDICLQTGNSGEDASSDFEHKELLADFYLVPYLESDPTFAFVLEQSGAVNGYAVGALDSIAFSRFMTDHYLPLLRNKYAAASDGFNPSEQEVWQLINSEFEVNEQLLARFPSHLHIDLLPVSQGRGYGKQLMEALCSAFAVAGSPGVHLGVSVKNLRALHFYQKMGFQAQGEEEGTIFMGLDLTSL
jgi:ribosomal protein S18 acetylase RimI-like enzyme